MTMTIQEIVHDVQNIKKYIVLKYPFFYPIISRLKVKISERVGTAGTDGKYVVISPSFWKSLKPEDKVFVLLHEALHVALKHVDKCRSKKYRGTYNVAADAIINTLLMKFSVKPSRELQQSIVTAEVVEKLTRGEIRAKDVERLSADEIYYVLLRHVKKEETEEFIVQREGAESEGEGGEEVEVPAQTSGELTPDVLQDVKNFAKQVGRLPADAETLIDNLTKPKVNWRQLLRIELGQVFGEKVISTWRRLNRKLPDVYPGYKRYGREESVREIWCLVDVSGSIVSEENVLKQFFTEVVDIASHFKAELHIVMFDVEVKNHFVAKNVNDVLRVISQVRGGGGTKPDAALRYFINNCKFSKNRKIAVILLSDGFFEVSKRLCDEVVTRVTRAIYVYTVEEHKFEFEKWRRIKLEI